MKEGFYMSTTYVLQTCDQWKSHASCRVKGCFTSEIKLKKAVVSLFKDNECDFDNMNIETAKKERRVREIAEEIKELSVEDINSRMTYISITSFKTNRLE